MLSESEHQEIQQMRDVDQIDDEVRKIDEELSRLNSDAADQASQREPHTAVRLNTQPMSSGRDMGEPSYAELQEQERRRKQRMKAF